MKYIRTKDGRTICLTMFLRSGDKIIEYDCSQEIPILDTKNGDKTADTIEELCDRFVVLFNGTRKNDQSILRNYQSAKTYFSKNKKYKLNHIKEIYGAIWTDKGLIYVAKMNEKGELELL